MQVGIPADDVAPARLPDHREQPEQVELGAIAVEHHALGAERAVHQPHRMRRVQPVRDTVKQLERQIGVERSAAEEVGKPSRRERFGGHEQLPASSPRLPHAQQRGVPGSSARVRASRRKRERARRPVTGVCAHLERGRAAVRSRGAENSRLPPSRRRGEGVQAVAGQHRVRHRLASGLFALLDHPESSKRWPTGSVLVGGGSGVVCSGGWGRVLLLLAPALRRLPLFGRLSLGLSVGLALRGPLGAALRPQPFPLVARRLLLGRLALIRQPALARRSPGLTAWPRALPRWAPAGRSWRAGRWPSAGRSPRT